MATFISTEKFERWWRKAQAWFATQFASINIDTSDLAKEDTLTQGVENIRNDISHIDIDTSELAKQGSNNNISLTTMDEKLGNVVMMTDAEYQPALDDLATKLN